MNIWIPVIVAIISGLVTIIATVLSNLSVHSKTLYRIEQLEKKQDRHNNLIERMYAVEKVVELLDERQKVSNHRIKDVEDLLKTE